MKRKDYRKPTTNIVQLRHTGMLMTSNPEPVGPKASINDWDDCDTDEEDIYM